MLQVLVLFFYMGITTWIIGYGALSFLSGCRRLTLDIPYGIRYRISYPIAGTVCVTVYAQIFSLFAPVGAAAFLLLNALCVLIAFLYRRKLAEELRGITQASRADRILWILLFLLFAYGTSHGIMHYDTGLYHAQSIRFIEEYGVVTGIANLHSRLGYNSASFAFSALYSFAFTGSQSLHAGAGFFALLLAYSCLDLRRILRKEKPDLSSFVRFAGLYYLFNIYKEMVSPAPDYFLNCFLFCLLILWLDLDGEQEKHFFPYALLTIGFGYSVTLKLSAAPLLLLVLLPVRRIIRAGKNRGSACIVRAIIGFIGIGFLIAGPYMARNVMISGWPLYPSTTPGFFVVPWQLPRDLADGDAAGVRAYAQEVPAPAPGASAASLTEWFPHWFFTQSMISRILIIADLLIAAGLAVTLIRILITGLRGRKRADAGGAEVFLLTVLSASFLFWLLASPLIRYGFFFVWTPPVLLCGLAVRRFVSRCSEKQIRVLTGLLALLLFVFLVYKGFRLIMTDRTLMQAPRLVTQQPYETYSVEPYEVDGVTFYAPVDGDRTGYDGFPGGDHKGGFRLLGDSLREGIAADR